MNTMFKISFLLIVSTWLAACGGGHRGARRAQNAVVAMSAAPAAVPPRSVREIENQIFGLDMKLKEDGAYNLERQTLIGWFHDVRGYDAAQRARIRANAAAIRALGVELKTAGVRLKDDATRERGSWFEGAATKLMRRMSRYDREEVAFRALTKAMTK